MEFEVLGSPQTVQKANGETWILRDPFLATVLDFTRRCLDQLAQGLHIVLVYNMDHCRHFNKKKFFLGENNRFVKDPRKHSSGFDILYLLKNIKYHRRLYSSNLEKSVSAMLRIVDFLLNLRNQLAHECYLCLDKTDLQISSKKYRTTKKCLDYSIKLLDWVANAEFYIPIRFEVTRIKENIENMRCVLEQLHEAREYANVEVQKACSAEEAKNLLKWMLDQVNLEESKEESFEHRPIIHLVNVTLKTRIIRKEAQN